MTHKFLLFVIGCMAMGLKAQNVSPDYTFPDTIIQNNSGDGISQGLSMSGYYQLGLKWDDKDRTPVKNTPVNFSKWEMENSIDQIIRKAKDARVVVINEGHDLANTRYFVLKVLQALKPLGFNSYGAETFSWEDNILQKRKYPIDSSGYYTQEPVFGEVVREAIKMGYRLFPYEDSVRYHHVKTMLDTLGSYMIVYEEIHDTARFIVKPNGEQMMYMGKRSQYREINQAKNIMSYLHAHPDAKAIIHVGYGHGCKDDDLMGFHLDTSLHAKMIDIDQEFYREHSDTAFEQPLYRQQHFSDYTSFTDSSGGSGLPQGYAWCKYDIAVAHPRTKYINGRPDWLYKMPERKEYATSSFQKIKAPSVLIAFYANEYKESQQHAIPLDVLELIEKENNPPLLLRPGAFTIVQIGPHGEKARYDVEVK